MNKDGQNAATALARVGDIAGLLGMINGDSISMQATKLQGKKNCFLFFDSFLTLLVFSFDRRRKTDFKGNN
jgi:hypothetical protein